MKIGKGELEILIDYRRCELRNLSEKVARISCEKNYIDQSYLDDIDKTVAELRSYQEQWFLFDEA